MKFILIINNYTDNVFIVANKVYKYNAFSFRIPRYRRFQGYTYKYITEINKFLGLIILSIYIISKLLIIQKHKIARLFIHYMYMYYYN